jgi:hypothetical protein
VRDTYVRLRSGDVEFIDEVLKKADDARKWQGTRDASKAARERFTGVLAVRDCDGNDIGYVTNAIYVVLLGGKASGATSGGCTYPFARSTESENKALRKIAPLTGPRRP